MIKYSLYKRDNYFWIDYYIENQRFRKTTKATRKAEAEKIADLIISKHHRDYYGKSDFTLGQIIDKYIHIIKAENKTWKEKIPRLQAFLETIGDKNLSEITHLECYEFINSLRSGRSPRTINRYIALYHHLFNKAIDFDMIQVNPFRKIKKAKEKPRLRFYTDEEIKRILQASKELSGHKNRELMYYIILTAIYTGMRLSEIPHLKWMDFRDNSFIIHKSKSGLKRIVPAHPDLMKELLKLNTSEEYIFPLTRREPNVIKRPWRLIRDKAKIQDGKFHDLRHYFASQLVKNCVDIVSISCQRNQIKTSQINPVNPYVVP